jgi:hypothetical protein
MNQLDLAKQNLFLIQIQIQIQIQIFNQTRSNFITLTNMKADMILHRSVATRN